MSIGIDKKYCVFCNKRAFKKFWRPSCAEWIWLCDVCLKEKKYKDCLIEGVKYGTNTD